MINFIKYLNLLTGNLIAIFLMIAWLFGFVLAKGFWSTFFCFIPFYAWYLVLERIAKSLNWI